MRRFFRLFGLLGLLAAVPAFAAGEYAPTAAISDTQTLASPTFNWGTFQQLTTMGYYTPGDGGGITFNKGDAPASTLGVPVTLTGAAHNGTATLDTLSGNPTTLHWQAGEHITDSAGRLPANTYIVKVTSTVITLSQAATGNSPSDIFTVDCANGGSIIKDGGNHCWFAQNPTSSLALWGLAKGSPYDASAFPTTVSYADTKTAAAFAVMPAQYGQNDFHTEGVNLAYAQDIAVPALGEFNCGATPGEFQPNALYDNLPGTLYLAHGADVILGAGNASGSEFGNCWLMPEWLKNPAKATFPGGRTNFHYPYQSFDDMQAVRRNQIAGGDDGVHCQGNSCMKVHDVTAIGFDNPFWGDKSGNFIGQNVFGDGNVGFYFNGGGGETIVTRSDVEPILTRNPASPLTSSEAFDITNITCSTHNTNAAGHCVIELTLQQIPASGGDPAGPSTNDIHDTTFLPDGVTPSSYTASSFNIKNSLGNPNGWNMGNTPIKVISQDGTNAVVDLLGSDFGSTSGGGSLVAVTGQWDANTQMLKIRGNADKFAQIHSGQIVTVSGGTGFPSGTVKVLTPVFSGGPDPTDAFAFEVPIDHKTSAAQTSDVTIFFDNGSFAASGHVCNGSNQGYCLNFDVSTFGYCGPSVACTAASRLPSSFGARRATSYLCDNAPGLSLEVPFSYGHNNHYAFIDCPRVSLTGERADNNKFNDDHGEKFMQAFGASNAVTVTDITGSAAGHGYIDDRWSLSDGAQTTTSDVAALAKTIGTIHLTSTAGFAANGDTLALCVALKSGGGCDTGQTYEIVKGQIGGGSTFVVNLRGAFGTLAQQFPSGTVYAVRQLVGPNKGCFNVKGTGAAITDSYLAILEAIHGCTQMSATRANQLGFAFVGDGALATQLNGNYWPNTSVIAENEKALATLSGTGNVCASAECPNDDTPYQPSGAAATPSGWTALAGDKTGTITGNFTGWPSTGVALVGSEVFAFKWDDAGSIDVTQRGACNTTPASHADADSTLYYNEYPCPRSGSASYWRRGDGLNDELVTPAGGFVPSWLSDIEGRRPDITNFVLPTDTAGDFAQAEARAWSAIAAKGSMTLYVTKDQIYNFSTFTKIPDGMQLVCLSSPNMMAVNGSNAPNGDHKHFHYTLAVPDAGIHGGANSKIKGCTIEHKPTYDAPNMSAPPTCCLQEMNALVATYAGTGVTADADGMILEDDLIIGFNLPFSSTGKDTIQISNVTADGVNCALFKNINLDPAQISQFKCMSLLTQQMSAGLQHLDNTAIAAVGGHYQFTFATCADASNNCPRTGDPDIFIGIPPGGTKPYEAESAQGHCINWRRDDDTHGTCLDTNTAAYVTTGTVTAYSRIVSGVDTSRVHFGQSMASALLPAGATVAFFNATTQQVWVDAAHTPTTGGAVSDLTFTDHAYTATAGHLLAVLPFPSYRDGVCFDFDNAQQIKPVDLQCYTHKVAYKFHNSSTTITCTNCSAEDEHNQMSADHTGIEFDDSAKDIKFIGGAIHYGSNGGHCVLNNTNSASNLNPNIIDGTSCGGQQDEIFLEDLGGNFLDMMQPSSENDGHIFAADAILGATIAHAKSATRTHVWFQSEMAASETCQIDANSAEVTIDGPALRDCPKYIGNAIAAFTGGGQAGATQLSKRLSRISTCGSADHASVALPQAVEGHTIDIVQSCPHIVDLYAMNGIGDTINNAAATAPVWLPAKFGTFEETVTCEATANGRWHCPVVAAVGYSGSAADTTNGVTGSGHIVLDTTPTIMSPVINAPTLHAPVIDGAAVIPSAMHPGYVSGRYYPPPFTTIVTNYAMAANVMYTEPFYVGKTVTFTKIAIDITTAAVANGNCEFAIYANNNGQPGALLQDLGNVAVTTGTTGTTGLTGLTITLNPGWYFPAFGCSNAPQVEAAASSNGLSSWLLGITQFTNAAVQMGVGWTYSAGAPPNPFGTPTYGTTAAQPFIDLGL